MRCKWQFLVDLGRGFFPNGETQTLVYFNHSGIYTNAQINQWSPYDSRTEDWIINQVTKQAVFNMYFTNPKGGKTEVHDCQWTEDALDWRDFSSYGYSEDLVKGRKKVIIQPKPADLCIFNSRNMHQVFPVEPEEDGTQRPRLSLSSFMGLIPAKVPGERPKLILWS